MNQFFKNSYKSAFLTFCLSLETKLTITSISPSVSPKFSLLLSSCSSFLEIIPLLSVSILSNIISNSSFFHKCTITSSTSDYIFLLKSYLLMNSRLPSFDNLYLKIFALSAFLSFSTYSLSIFRFTIFSFFSQKARVSSSMISFTSILPFILTQQQQQHQISLMNFSSPRRIFRKGENARKKHLQEQEQFKVSRYAQISVPHEQSPAKNAEVRKYSASTRYRTKKGVSLQRANQSRQFPSTCYGSLKLSSFDKVGHIQYDAKPILTQRPNFMVRYKKMYRSYEN